MCICIAHLGAAFSRKPIISNNLKSCSTTLICECAFTLACLVSIFRCFVQFHYREVCSPRRTEAIRCRPQTFHHDIYSADLHDPSHPVGDDLKVRGTNRASLSEGQTMLAEIPRPQAPCSDLLRSVCFCTLSVLETPLSYGTLHWLYATLCACQANAHAASYATE